MKRKIGFFIIFFLVQISCGHRSALHDVIHSESAQNDNYVLDTSIIAILKGDRMEKAYFNETTPFHLTNKELALIEGILNSSVAIRNEEQRDPAYHEYMNMYQDTVEIYLPDYKRQYFPFQEKDGKKKVWVNCFYHLKRDQEYWKTRMVKVRDGGFWYFNLMIDLDAKKCLFFRVNGKA